MVQVLKRGLLEPLKIASLIFLTSFLLLIALKKAFFILLYRLQRTTYTVADIVANSRTWRIHHKKTLEKFEQLAI